jgi:hypothetical protein
MAVNRALRLKPPLPIVFVARKFIANLGARHPHREPSPGCSRLVGRDYFQHVNLASKSKAQAHLPKRA